MILRVSEHPVVILVTSDSHCYYDTINKQIVYAETELGVSIDCVIHLGDFGLYASHLYDFFIRSHKRFLKPLYCIDGNHEDFSALHKLVRKYEAFFTYLPRSTVHVIGGYRFLALGGAAYMDSMITESASLITDEQIDRCLRLSPDAVDIIITHDCPTNLGVPNTPGMECYGAPGFARSEELSAHFHPKLWFFGHHHKWFTHQDEGVIYQGLCGTWKGFVLLDDAYRYRVVTHQLEWEKSSLIERILVKLRIIRPDQPSGSNSR